VALLGRNQFRADHNSNKDQSRRWDDVLLVRAVRIFLVSPEQQVIWESYLKQDLGMTGKIGWVGVPTPLLVSRLITSP